MRVGRKRWRYGDRIIVERWYAEERRQEKGPCCNVSTEKLELKTREYIDITACLSQSISETQQEFKYSTVPNPTHKMEKKQPNKNYLKPSLPPPTSPIMSSSLSPSCKNKVIGTSLVSCHPIWGHPKQPVPAGPIGGLWTGYLPYPWLAGQAWIRCSVEEWNWPLSLVGCFGGMFTTVELNEAIGMICDMSSRDSSSSLCIAITSQMVRYIWARPRCLHLAPLGTSPST